MATISGAQEHSIAHHSAAPRSGNLERKPQVRGVQGLRGIDLELTTKTFPTKRIPISSNKRNPSLLGFQHDAGKDFD